MKDTTLILPGFHLSTLRKKPQTKAQKLTQALDKIKKIPSINWVNILISLSLVNI